MESFHINFLHAYCFMNKLLIFFKSYDKSFMESNIFHYTNNLLKKCLVKKFIDQN